MDLLELIINLLIIMVVLKLNMLLGDEIQVSLNEAGDGITFSKKGK